MTMTTAYQVFYEAPTTNPREPRHILAATTSKKEALEVIADLRELKPETSPIGYGFTHIHSSGDAFEQAKADVGKTF